jgi:hypothetical protein
MQYRSEATSLEGFVQQIACCYLRHGYWWYVMGAVPGNKDPSAVDRKLIEKYGIAVSESTRARRKQAGLANLQYLRLRRVFVILATRGRHVFFDAEGGAVRDMRRHPIKIGGYSISYRRSGRTHNGAQDGRFHAHVQIERRVYLELKAHFVDRALRHPSDRLALAFYHLPFEPYAPVRRQMLNVLRAVNKVRKAAGHALVPVEALPMRRRIVKPFGDRHTQTTEGNADFPHALPEEWIARLR